ncbi:MAG: thiamine pyrophosphate-dependent enzyme [Pseudomonadota bacterium]
MSNADHIWKCLIENQVDKVTYLPCNKLNALIQAKPETMEIWDITKESVGLGLCFGRSLAGKRTAMMIQNTGLGNLITELYTMQKLYQEALPIFVSWRGYYQEPIEAQIIFGSKVESLLDAIDVEYQILKSSEDIENLSDDLNTVFEQNKVKVYLISPELWETNSPDFHVFGHPRIAPVQTEADGYSGEPTLNRIGAIAEIMSTVGDEDVVVSQIGFPSKEVYNTRDRDLNFYMLGALGSATEVGIALAAELPDRKVFVIDGDGSFIFNPNQLIDLATMGSPNLSVICLDNGSWGSTGNQPTLTSQGMNLTAMVRSMGPVSTCMTDDAARLHGAIRDNVSFIHYMIQAGNDKVGGEIPLKALEIKNRFMAALQ